MTDKRQLRAELRARRDTFAQGEPLTPPRPYLDLLRPGLIVASYHPFGSEADPLPFAEAARMAGARIALPHVVDRATPLRFRVDGPLTDGPFGLRQPHADADELVPDLILTPLVGFDRAGNRLGQGAGHYDRAFAALPHGIRIGIAWSIQEVDRLPSDPWDVPLHAIATEQEWIVP